METAESIPPSTSKPPLTVGEMAIGEREEEVDADEKDKDDAVWQLVVVVDVEPLNLTLSLMYADHFIGFTISTTMIRRSTDRSANLASPLIGIQTQSENPR